MKIFLHIALRNLLRHKNRSAITLLAIIVGLGALIFLWSFTDGAHRQMIVNITTMMTSDAQVVPKELENILNTNGVIENPEAVRTELRNNPMIAGFAERILAGGLIATSTRSQPVLIIGIDPAAEAAIGSRAPVNVGRFLTERDANGAVMGTPLARSLDLQLGQKTVLTAQDYYGALTGGVFRLVGTGETGNEHMDNGDVFVLSSTLKELLSLDHRISVFALKIHPQYDFDEAVRSLQPKMAAMGLSVLSWRDLLPMVSQLINYNEGRNLVLVFIILAVVALGIYNTLMMSVVERTHEFGLMMAIGTKPRQIIKIVMLESLLITFFGSLLALMLGIGLTLYFGKVGVSLAAFSKTFSNLFIGSSIYPEIVWSHVIISIAIIWIGNLLASLYPTWRASRLDPIEAMRQAG